MMKSGIKYNFGNVILAFMQFTDSGESKARPALVLFEEFGNIVCAGITSNPNMQGIKITKNEGMVEDSVIKINYIMTISEKSVKRSLFNLSSEKKEIVKNEIINRLK